MKKLFSVLLAALLLCSLCGVTAAADDAEDVCGSYTLISAISEEDGDLTESIRIMNEMGMASTLTVNADGSGLLDLFGEEHALQFDFAAETFTSDDGEELPYHYEDGQITIGDESNSFLFSKEGLEESEEPFQGPFRFYTLTDVMTEDGESVLDEYVGDEEEIDDISLFLFDDGSALFQDLDDTLEMFFDFEEMTVTVGEGDSYPFSLEDTVLIIMNDAGELIVLEQEDPGFEGPYVMISLVTEGEGDMTDQLKLLDAVGMLPTLAAEEDGSAVLDLFGEEMHLQFDFEAMEAEMDGERLPFTYEYGELLIGDETNSMGFARVLPEAEES